MQEPKVNSIRVSRKERRLQQRRVRFRTQMRWARAVGMVTGLSMTSFVASQMAGKTAAFLTSQAATKISFTAAPHFQSSYNEEADIAINQAHTAKLTFNQAYGEWRDFQSTNDLKTATREYGDMLNAESQLQGDERQIESVIGTIQEWAQIDIKVYGPNSEAAQSSMYQRSLAWSSQSLTDAQTSMADTTSLLVQLHQCVEAAQAVLIRLENYSNRKANQDEINSIPRPNLSSAHEVVRDVAQQGNGGSDVDLNSVTVTSSVYATPQESTVVGSVYGPPSTVTQSVYGIPFMNTDAGNSLPTLQLATDANRMTPD